ncbi:MAG: NADH-quinone oxidoreductase subunit NuoG [Candidatus Eiseniibacteriota bacterium]
MARVWIDGVEHDVDAAKNLLQVCLEKGLDLPYFCWHPALGSVGACRQCAVKQFRDEKDTTGRIVMACMTPAAEGTRVGVADPEAQEFRKSITELLMVNHPHDCPICDEGGECHLQDMTVMTGHRSRHFRFAKKTYTNQDLGPFVNHEMNRCIQCYRCVHFYRDHAGGTDLQAFAAHDHVYFGRHADGTLESPFSGNLIEVCPTGVFTDKTFKRHYTRPWDLQTAPSVCVHCSLGCSTSPGERYGALRRIRARYHGKVNGYFLCDRGRFGYEFANDDRRIRHPRVRAAANTSLQDAPRDVAVARVAELLRGGKAFGVGSPRASVEANFALRTLVGPDRFFQGISSRDAELAALWLSILGRGGFALPSLREMESCDAVLVLGEDVTNTAPLADLAIRQAVKRAPEEAAAKLQIPLWHADAMRTAVQGRRGPLFVATAGPSSLDDAATRSLRAAPDDVARLACAVARALDPVAPEVPGLSAETSALVAEIAAALRDAKAPLVVTGTGAGSASILESAANVACALSRAGRPARLFSVLPECDSFGLALFGAPALEAVLPRVEQGEVDTVIVLENDLSRRLPAPAVERLLGAVRHLVVLDHLPHATAERAEVVLPAATFAESDGTHVNNEARAQRFYQVFVPETEIQESWRWLRDAARAAGRTEMDGWNRVQDVTAAAAAALPACRDLVRATPAAEMDIEGVTVPRASHRYSGRTAMRAHTSVHEPKPPADPDSSFSFSMEGYEGPLPAAVAARFWAPGWNSIQALNRFQEEIGGPLRDGDSGVRLLEPNASARPDYFPPADAFRPRAGELLLVALHHVFGSEELSAAAPGVAELSPDVYLAISPEDAAALGLRPGGAAGLALDGMLLTLPVRVTPGLARGIAGLPRGLAGVPVVDGPAWARISGR